MKGSWNVNFRNVGRGRLGLSHRPKNTDFLALHEMGCTHVITLLKESEGAERYGNMTREASMVWIWLPVPNGKHPEGEVHQLLFDALPRLSQLLDDGNSILIHCSAGIHRTGMVAYALLRWRGMNREQAMKRIGEVRRETAEGLLEKRMRWGDEIARPATTQQDGKWLHFAREFVDQLKIKLSRLL